MQVFSWGLYHGSGHNLYSTLWRILCGAITGPPSLPGVLMVMQVFGKTLLCKDLDVANAAAHRTHLNCVTMGGDQVSKKGSITGGFRDLSR